MQHRRQTRNLKKDLQIGIKVGLLFAAAYSILSTITYVIGGRSRFMARVKVDLPIVLLSYLFGGLVGGVFIGLMRPLRTTALGSFCIGTVSAMPLCLFIVAVGFPRNQWYPLGLVSALIVSLVMGGGLGAVFHGDTKGWTE